MNVRALIGERIEAALAETGNPGAPALVQPASRPEFGDYQANGVMGAAKRSGTKPRELADAVLKAAALDDVAAGVEVAGPGFLNITLADDFLSAQLLPEDRMSAVEHPQTVVVDYSSPNLAKAMHVGHLRSTIIGDAVARVLEALGHTVIRQNHVGDWGTQFGMLLTHMTETGADSNTLSDLEDFYREAKARFDADPDFAERSRQTVVRLQSGDPDTRAHWSRFIDISLSHCQAIYDRLGVKLTAADVAAESAYNDALPEVIEALRASGLLEESDGALCVFLDEFTGKDDQPLPVIVRKSDGGYLYATTDLAAIAHRSRTLHADRAMYFTDARQALHFRQVFAVARTAGLAAPEMRLDHLPFGNMLGKDGTPFKTREGGVVRLEELLDEAEVRAYALVGEKSPDLPETERRQIARAVGIGAIKFADLSKNRTSDYVFDWDQMLSFEGNTAPYLQYAYSRIRSVFRRGDVQPDALDTPARVEMSTPEERGLAVMLVRFQEVLEQVATEACPHFLCAYLYELASAFTRFYEACPILTADEPLRASRLFLADRTATTLEQGLGLLGIETMERM
ncbi:MAG TPA: arginine--tRNA ligase [Pseudomonadales bacterium]|jgi:arginyl-tRNA synthetase